MGDEMSDTTESAIEQTLHEAESYATLGMVAPALSKLADAQKYAEQAGITIPADRITGLTQLIESNKDRKLLAVATPPSIQRQPSVRSPPQKI